MTVLVRLAISAGSGLGLRQSRTARGHWTYSLRHYSGQAQHYRNPVGTTETSGVIQYGKY